jgi:hypothetical protein
MTGRFHRPSTVELSAVLRGMLVDNELEPREPVVLNRSPNTRSSTFRSEIVTCRLRCGQLTLHCKYSENQWEEGHTAGDIDDHTAYGYRGGVAYEATVYRLVLSRIDLTRPRFFGAHVDHDGGTWLVLEHLDGSRRLSGGGDPALPVGAAWIGAFHAHMAGRVAAGDVAAVRRYDAAYYLGWAERTAAFTASLAEEFGWFQPLCASFGSAVDLLLKAEPTVVHGEYTVHNVLWRDGQVCPIDWETAAVAAGEIDLATLTHGWPTAAVEAARTAYRTARWPAGPPTDHVEKLDAAELYSIFRWLGYRSEWPDEQERRDWVRSLREPGERLGLI